MLNKLAPDRNEWLLIIFLAVLATYLLHGSALSGYWRFDDGAHLMFATEYSPWQYFFDPKITRLQSGANVTPWNVFFYDVNLFIFGFEPRGFYFHILLLIVATALSLFSLLRCWFPLPAAGFGMILFLSGKPTGHLAQELMTNHYLTGMLFSLLSLNFFASYIRFGNQFKWVTAVVLYALAMTCKEVYAPLIALLFVLPVGDLKQRLYAITPFFGVAIAYVLWRHAVLGVWIGGYSPDAAQISYQTIVQQLAHIPFYLFDDHGWGIVGLAVLIIMFVLALWNRVINLPLLLVSVFILFLPLIPLTLSPGITQADRYLFAPWTALSVLAANMFQRINRGQNSQMIQTLSLGIKTASALILVAISAMGNSNEMQRIAGIIDKSEDIYRFALETDFSREALMLDTNDADYWAYVSLEARHASDLAKKTPSASPIIVVNSLNGLFLLDDIVQRDKLDLSAIQFYRYGDDFSPLDIKPIIQMLKNTLHSGKNEQLKMKFQQKNGVITWEFWPKGIDYSAIIWKGKDNSRYPILKLQEKGAYPWNIDDEILISIAFQNDKTWLAISPKILFDPSKKEIIWQGKSNMEMLTKKLDFLLSRLDFQKTTQ